MLLNKRMLNVAKICAKKSGFYAFAGLLLDKGSVVASDGKRLIKADFVTGQEEDYPEMESVPKDKNFKTLLPASKALQLIKQIPKSKNMPILNHIKLGFEKGNKKKAEKIKVGYTDLENTAQEDVRPVEGKFPEYQNILNELKAQKPIAEITVNPRLLAEMLQQFILSDRFEAVKLSFYADKTYPALQGDISLKPTPQAMKLYTKCQDVGEIEGLLMPLTIEL